MPQINIEDLTLNTEDLSSEERLLVERLYFLHDEIERAERRLEVFIEMAVKQGEFVRRVRPDG